MQQDALLISQPADPANGRGGWLDKNGNGKPDSADEFIDTRRHRHRLFDYSSAEFVRSDPLPAGVLTPTANLPPAHCGYQQFHIDTVAMASATGMTFSPDGTQIAIPLLENGKSQIHIASPDGTNPVCINGGCSETTTAFAGVPATPTRSSSSRPYTHKDATGNAGGGFGQEPGCMHADDRRRLAWTTSDIWKTNHTSNWSPRTGCNIVWDAPSRSAPDVMIAGPVIDTGCTCVDLTLHPRHHLRETCTAFIADNKYVITTNTRAGFQTTDLYAIEIATGNRYA